MNRASRLYELVPLLIQSTWRKLVDSSIPSPAAVANDDYTVGHWKYSVDAWLLGRGKRMLAVEVK